LRRIIPVSSPMIDVSDIRSVTHALESGQISGSSPMVSEFEEQYANFVGRRHAVGVTNGTAALELSLRVANVGPGDEVILPTFSIISVLLAVKKTGATPIFVDCDPLHWNSGPDEIIAAITSRTRAIILVHTYGLPVDLDPIISHIENLSITLIEDASEAHGLQYKDKRCGSFGQMSTFSFYANKHVTTGEGGMVLTDSESLASRMKYLSNLAMNPNRRFRHTEFGDNFRLSGLQCALGISQLKKIDKIRQIKRNIAEKYDSLFVGVEAISIPVKELTYAKNDYWVYGVVPKVSPERSTEIQARLMQSGIETRPFFYPLHLQPCYESKSLLSGQFPNATILGERGFYLPTPFDLSQEEIEYIGQELKDLL
jgi:perosamine synthetase